MKRFLLAVIALASGVATSEEVSDDKIKSMIVGSECYIDNSRASERMFKNARRRCGDDTNRFARILCELAQTSDVHLSDRMISRLGRHGTAAQLPFLYSMATNEQHGATAVKSILWIEGVTSNSLEAADLCLLTKSIKEPERLSVCRTLVGLAYAESTPSNAQVCALSYIYMSMLGHVTIRRVWISRSFDMIQAIVRAAVDCRFCAMLMRMVLTNGTLPMSPTRSTNWSHTPRRTCRSEPDKGCYEVNVLTDCRCGDLWRKGGWIACGRWTG